MVRKEVIGSAIFGLLALGGCAENTAPGNDRAAEHAPRPAPARLAPPSEAVREAKVSAVYPETMTTEEVGHVIKGRSCRFTYTGVGDPVLVIEVAEAGAPPGRGVMKLNGKLVELQAGGRGGQDVVGGATMMQAEGLRAIIKPDHESGEVKGNGERRREGALLFKIEGADEVGFWGFYSCGMVVKGKAAAKTRAESPELATNTGAEVYRQGRCYVCHGALGYGGVGPQFRGHDNLKDDKHVVGAILDGPGEMPAFADTLTNEQIAAVSTYIRTHWGNDYGSVTPDRVAEIRKSRAE